MKKTQHWLSSSRLTISGTILLMTCFVCFSLIPGRWLSKWLGKTFTEKLVMDNEDIFWMVLPSYLLAPIFLCVSIYLIGGKDQGSFKKILILLNTASASEIVLLLYGSPGGGRSFVILLLWISIAGAGILLLGPRRACLPKQRIYVCQASYALVSLSLFVIFATLDSCFGGGYISLWLSSFAALLILMGAMKGMLRDGPIRFDLSWMLVAFVYLAGFSALTYRLMSEIAAAIAWGAAMSNQ